MMTGQMLGDHRISEADGTPGWLADDEDVRAVVVEVRVSHMFVLLAIPLLTPKLSEQIVVLDQLTGT